MFLHEIEFSHAVESSSFSPESGGAFQKCRWFLSSRDHIRPLPNSCTKTERPFDMLNFPVSACPACLTPKTLSKTYLNSRSKSTSVRPVLDHPDDSGSRTSSTMLEELEAVALPEFDDPNIDKDEAIVGVLGE